MCGALYERKKKIQREVEVWELREKVPSKYRTGLKSLRERHHPKKAHGWGDHVGGSWASKAAKG